MTLLLPAQVDRLLRYERGRSQRLAKAGQLPHIVLPDGQIRFDKSEIEKLLTDHRQTGKAVAKDA